MTNYSTATYNTLADLLVAIELIDNGVEIQIVPYQEAGLQKYILVVGASVV